MPKAPHKATMTKQQYRMTHPTENGALYKQAMDALRAWKLDKKKPKK